MNRFTFSKHVDPARYPRNWIKLLSRYDLVEEPERIEEAPSEEEINESDDERGASAFQRRPSKQASLLPWKKPASSIWTIPTPK